MIKNKQGGFTLIESILIIAVLAGLVYAAYHFGWGIPGKAGEQLLKNDIETVQNAVGIYVLESNGLYPTDGGDLPAKGEYKLIVWDARCTSGAKEIFFYPVILARLPRHWDEGVWRIDSLGRVSVTIKPEDY